MVEPGKENETVKNRREGQRPPNSRFVVEFVKLQNTTVERCSAVDLITGQPTHWPIT